MLILLQVIYRNVHVNNAVLAFSCIGCMKIPMVTANIYSISESSFDEDLELNIGWLKSLSFLLAYLCEDCAELLLEYFYIEKFFTDRPAWYLIGKKSNSVNKMNFYWD